MESLSRDNLPIFIPLTPVHRQIEALAWHLRSHALDPAQHASKMKGDETRHIKAFTQCLTPAFNRQSIYPILRR
jgi:hypothetical protein